LARPIQECKTSKTASQLRATEKTKLASGRSSENGVGAIKTSNKLKKTHQRTNHIAQHGEQGSQQRRDPPRKLENRNIWKDHCRKTTETKLCRTIEGKIVKMV
jgi:hypothetical protein